MSWRPWEKRIACWYNGFGRRNGSQEGWSWEEGRENRSRLLSSNPALAFRMKFQCRGGATSAREIEVRRMQQYARVKITGRVMEKKKGFVSVIEMEIVCQSNV